MNRKLDALWLWNVHDFSGKRTSFFLGYSSILAVLCFVSLAVPEKMYLSTMAHDVMIFLDGIHRVGLGQVPHVDFVSPLGPFIYYFPLAVGYLPGLDASLSDAMAVLSLLTLIASAYLALTRMNFTVGLLFVTSATLLVAAPVVPGTSSREITFAMFYNRIGYGAVMLMMAFLLQPRRQVSALAEGSLIGLVGLVLLNTKITFFAAWLGVLLAVTLLNPASRAAVLVGGALLGVLGIGLVAWMPDMYQAYLRDLGEARAAKVGDGTLESIWKTFRKNVVYFAVVLWATWYVAKRAYHSRRSQFLFTGAVAAILVGSVVLFVMNAQTSFLVLPEMALLVLAAMEYRSAPAARVSGLFALLLLVALFRFMPEFDTRFSVLNRYLANGSDRQVEYPFYVAPEIAERFVIKERGLLFAGFPNREVVTIPEIRGLMLDAGPRQEISQEDYLYSLSQGVVALKEAMETYGEGSVMTMDFSNPFSLLLGLEPPSGDYLWYHDGVNVSPGSMREARRLFADVRYVMVPVIPARLRSRDFLWKEYEGYVTRNYRQVGSDGLWDIWLRKDHGANR